MSEAQRWLAPDGSATKPAPGDNLTGYCVTMTGWGWVRIVEHDPASGRVVFEPVAVRGEDEHG